MSSDLLELLGFRDYKRKQELQEIIFPKEFIIPGKTMKLEPRKSILFLS